MVGMTGIEAAKAILSDSFDRVAQQVAAVTDGLSADDAGWRPDPGANSIAWLIWHLTRVQDDHVADLAGTEQVWTTGGWQQRFGLPFEAAETGYGHSADEVGQVAVDPADLAGYQRAVHEATSDYLATLDEAELERIVDTRWDPPVTASVRLVSVVNDCTEHIGQAAYVKGMLGRR